LNWHLILRVSAYVFMFAMAAVNLMFSAINAYRFNAITQRNLFVWSNAQAALTSVLIISILAVLYLRIKDVNETE